MKIHKKVLKYFKYKIKRNPITVNKAKKSIMEGKFYKNLDNANQIKEKWIHHPRITEFEKGENKSKFLFEQIQKHTKLEFSSPILEMGCAVGRNLIYLWKNNFKNISGLEINETAVKYIQKNYSEFYDNSEIILGSIEEEIKKYKDKQFELVFTMATLQYVPPSNNFIFHEIARISSKYIITIERENFSSVKHEYPRDYKKIFTELEFTQTAEIKCNIPTISNKDGYKIRIFQNTNI
jgi:hypothetical protein